MPESNVYPEWPPEPHMEHIEEGLGPLSPFEVVILTVYACGTLAAIIAWLTTYVL